MKLFTLPTLVCLATFTLGSAALATGQSGMDSSFVAFKNISSTSPATPTVVNTVVVTCPFAGNLISVVSAQITMNTTNTQAGETEIQYGLSKNATSLGLNSYHLLREYNASGIINATANFQRVDSCTAGQTVTIRFLAHRIDAESASAEKSSLVVTFIQGARI
jgi:hypothetical protein